MGGSKSPGGDRTQHWTRSSASAGASCIKQGVPSGAEPNSEDAGATLCQDTSGRVFQQLLPPQPAIPSMEGMQHQGAKIQVGTWIQDPIRATLSPRTFERRLRHSAPIFQDLQQVSAVSPVWARRADREGWPAAHAYLYQEPGTKGELRQRYSDSKR